MTVTVEGKQGYDVREVIVDGLGVVCVVDGLGVICVVDDLGEVLCCVDDFGVVCAVELDAVEDFQTLDVDVSSHGSSSYNVELDGFQKLEVVVSSQGSSS